jgi:hypothetical protein
MFVPYCDKKTKFLVLAFLILGICLLLIVQNCADTIEKFESRILFTNTNRTGENINGLEKTQYTIYDPNSGWLIWSCDVDKKWVFKITASGAPGKILYMRSPGKLNNLPAALGGLPAKDGYAAIFNSKTQVKLELIKLNDARNEIKNMKDMCLEHSSEEYCENEHTNIV